MREAFKPISGERFPMVIPKATPKKAVQFKKTFQAIAAHGDHPAAKSIPRAPIYEGSS